MWQRWAEFEVAGATALRRQASKVKGLDAVGPEAEPMQSSRCTIVDLLASSVRRLSQALLTPTSVLGVPGSLDTLRDTQIIRLVLSRLCFELRNPTSSLFPLFLSLAISTSSSLV